MNAASQIDASLEAQLREILDSMRAKDQPQMRLEATKILGSVTASLPLPAFRKLGLVAALKARFQDHAVRLLHTRVYEHALMNAPHY
jgi:hypothetical protein